MTQTIKAMSAKAAMKVRKRLMEKPAFLMKLASLVASLNETGAVL